MRLVLRINRVTACNYASLHRFLYNLTLYMVAPPVHMLIVQSVAFAPFLPIEIYFVDLFRSKILPFFSYGRHGKGHFHTTECLFLYSSFLLLILQAFLLVVFHFVLVDSLHLCLVRLPAFYKQINVQRVSKTPLCTSSRHYTTPAFRTDQSFGSFTLQMLRQIAPLLSFCASVFVLT